MEKTDKGGRIAGTKNGEKIFGKTTGVSVPNEIYPFINGLIKAWKAERKAHFALRGPTKTALLDFLEKKGL